MAGRVPVGSDRAEVASEMESTFVQNLQYAADVLMKVNDKNIAGNKMHCLILLLQLLYIRAE